MKKVIISIFSVAFLFFSCSDNPENYIKHLNGYWEIKHVEKNNQLLKEYSVNATIDFFEVNKETLTGFRKKVAPTLEGKYIITQHESPFKLKIEDNSLIIQYNVNGIEFNETIISASKEKLVITNEEGLTYVYRPFIALNFE